MNRRTQAAVALQVLILALVLLPPLILKYTGTTVYLETERVDPRALLRGDYVILAYRVAHDILSEEQTASARRSGRPVYVTVTTERPARFVAASLERPRLEPGQACIIGRSRGQGAVDFPQIAQYFVPEGEGKVIQGQLGENLLARVSTSGRCNAVLNGLEAKQRSSPRDGWRIDLRSHGGLRRRSRRTRSVHCRPRHRAGSRRPWNTPTTTRPSPPVSGAPLPRECRDSSCAPSPATGGQARLFERSSTVAAPCPATDSPIGQEADSPERTSES